MNVSYATSDLYAMYTGISLISLLENNRHIKDLNIFLLVTDISENNIKRFHVIENEYGRKIQFININNILEGYKKHLPPHNGSMMTYARLFPDLIYPKEVERVFVIDSDTIVKGSIEEIMNISMDDYVYAMAENPEFEWNTDMLDEYEKTAYEKSKKYYNAGMVLYNLNNYRKYNIGQYIRAEMEKGNQHPYVDQSIIYCAVPHQYIKTLPLKYNSFFHMFPKCCINDRINELSSIYDKDEMIESYSNPIIVHYKGTHSRPWYKQCTSIEKGAYAKYKIMSPWRNVKSENYYKSSSYLRMSFKEKIRHKMVVTLYQTKLYASIYYIKKKLFR